MGRELKRVPLDFDWPLRQVWEGYIRPSEARECWVCDGTGYSPAAKILENRWYGQDEKFKPEDRGSTPYKPTDDVIVRAAKRNVDRSPGYYGSGPAAVQREAKRLCDLFNKRWSSHLNEEDVKVLVEADRLREFTHTWNPEDGYQEKVPKYTPTPKEVNDWSIAYHGHDAINTWLCVKAECKRLNVSTSCSCCKGEGRIWPSEVSKETEENWKPTNPPSGEGYQVWETTSEGSPISPVFATPDELAEWLSCNLQGTIDEGTTKEQWLKFICGSGSSVTFVSSNGRMLTGVQAEAERATND